VTSSCGRAEGTAASKGRLEIRNLTRETVIARRVEVADRSAARNKGLLGRRSLAPDEGMWIAPCEAVHTLFMRFPIDLIYLDRGRRVKKIRSNLPPWRISGCFSAHSVLELAAGAIGRSGTQPGDTLQFFPAELENER
jgi:uncharacterized membrane protein (UPF0127 family)